MKKLLFIPFFMLFSGCFAEVVPEKQRVIEERHIIIESTRPNVRIGGEIIIETHPEHHR